MSGAQGLKTGRVYKLTSVGCSQQVVDLDRHTRRAWKNIFTGSATQQWTAHCCDGFWKFKNVATGLYLGFDIGPDVIKTGARVVGTEDRFFWDVVEMGNSGSVTEIILRAPHTIQVLDGELDGTKVLQFWGEHKGPNQRWFLSTDIYFTPPCEAGKTYKIVNSQSGTVVHLDDNNDVYGYSYNQGPNQLWEAIPNQTNPVLWSFRNILNDSYLGIDRGEAKEGTPVIGVSYPFAWRVESQGQDGFRLFVPYTSLNIDLHNGESKPGTVIRLYRRISGKHWKFEKDDDILLKRKVLDPGPP